MGVPAMLGLMVLAKPMLNVLFMRGEFTNNDVDMASFALMAYSCGLLSFMMIKVLAPGFYARQDTKTPVKIGIKAMIANMGFNLVFALALGYEYGYIGLAFATALSATCNAFWLHQQLKNDGVYHFSTQTVIFAIKAMIAAVMMAAIVFFLNPEQNFWLEADIWLKVIELTKLIMIAAVSYFSLMAVLGVRPSHLKSEST